MTRSATSGSAAARRFTQKTSAGEIFRLSMAASQRSLARLGRQGDDPLDEVTVHHFRTAIRRVRSLLSSFKDLLPAGERKALSTRLKALSQRYAELREWDVLIASSAAADVDRAKLAGLAAAARERRAAAMPRAAALIGDIRRARDAIAAAPWLDAPSPGETLAWNRPIGEFAADLLDRQRRRMRKGARGLDLANPASFHRFRIAAKKHRYAVEFLTPLYGKRKTKEYLTRLVAIQDVLGDMRDALIEKELVAKLGLPPATRALAMRWLNRRVAKCRRQFPACDKAFRADPPFWEQ